MSFEGSLRFVSYRSKYHPSSIIGLLSADSDSITPLRFPDNSPIRSLHHLIEEWEKLGLPPSSAPPPQDAASSDAAAAAATPLSGGDLPHEGTTASHKGRLVFGTPVENVGDVEVLAPLRGRDVICVGKNYKDHAEEFHKSGYDKSASEAQPEYPVIFTKRASSIVGHGHPIYPHPLVTQSVDYEGELAIIIGKGGLGIKKEQAWEHVWGATIVNDVTARERQRDHRQFYIGKSLDTFCPMGPWAVHASALDFNNMHLTTKVNDEIRQSQSTSELIFDIPTLIETCSMGITLQPGDVIATGTPAGVALSHARFLQKGDVVEITITGLGTLRNEVSDGVRGPPKCASVRLG